MQDFRSSLQRFAGPGVAALFATLVILTFPNFPYEITDALSEKAVLMHAHEQGWHFGKDIVFSYGPLGFLASRNYFAHAAGLRFAVDLLLSFGVCAGVVRLAWRLKPVWRWLLIGAFLFFDANIDPRYDLLLYQGIFSWAALCILNLGTGLLVDIVCFAALTAFGILIKANFLFLSAVTVPAVAADLLLRSKRREALMLLIAVAGCFLAGWFGAGQTWTNLPAFFAHVPALARGYNDAVVLDGLQVLRFRGVIAVLLMALAALLRSKAAWPSQANGLDRADETKKSSEQCESQLAIRRIVLVFFFSGFLFLVWKHGFVRGDLFHMGFFFGFSPFLALAFEAWPTRQSLSARLSRVFGLSSVAVVVFTMQRWCFPPFPSSLIQPFIQASIKAGILFHPGKFEKESLDAQNAAFSTLELPAIRKIVGAATVDVFGQDQLFALRNGLNYRPRPVFQSYMGYNSQLDRLNEEYYLSPSAPEYVIFQLTPIDHRFPPLEDSMTLRALLFNYDAVARESPCLLLKRRALAPPRRTLLKQVTARLGERVSLTEFGETNLWMEIRVHPSLLGRARSLFYKPTPTRVAVWSGKSKTAYKAPAPMIEAGFIATPLIMNGQDTLKFLEGAGKGLPEIEPHSLKRPGGYSVQVDSGNELFWQPVCEFRIYALEGT